MITLQIPELEDTDTLNTPLPITLNNNRYLLVREESYHEMEAAVKNINAHNEIHRQRIAKRVELAKSLFGILPTDITLEEAREERLSKI